MDILSQIAAKRMKESVPDFSVGDTVRVDVRVVERRVMAQVDVDEKLLADPADLDERFCAHHRATEQSGGKGRPL